MIVEKRDQADLIFCLFYQQEGPTLLESAELSTELKQKLHESIFLLELKINTYINPYPHVFCRIVR